MKSISSSGTTTSLAEIYRSRLESAKDRILTNYLNSGLLAQIERISSAYEPRLIGHFVDQANENIILDELDPFGNTYHDSSSELNASKVVANNNGAPRALNQVLSSDIFGTF